MGDDGKQAEALALIDRFKQVETALKLQGIRVPVVNGQNIATLLTDVMTKVHVLRQEMVGVLQWSQDVERMINQLEKLIATAGGGTPIGSVKIAIELEDKLTIGYKSIDELLPPAPREPGEFMRQALTLAQVDALIEWARQLEGLLKVTRVEQGDNG